MEGPRKDNILQLLQKLVDMRTHGLEPPNDGSKYTP